MEITFYGVRGSIPSPGPKTAKYGGNTSCVHVKLNSGKDLIFDSGSGIRSLGKKLANKNTPIHLLLSHNHWDHIQGYPFFAPVYERERIINVYTCVPSGDSLLCSLFDQMDGSNFPVKSEDLPSQAQCILEGIEEKLARENILVSRKIINHPGGGHAFRLEEDGCTVLYVTDNELNPPGTPATSYDEWVEFCNGADVLIHDAQYQAADMPHKHGWGHSLISQVRQLAVDAEVQSLVMFHHDPDRTDSELDAIQLENERFFKSKRAPKKSYCAAEGMTLSIAARLANKKPVIGTL